MASRRVVPSLIALCVLIGGVSLAVALKAPPAQPPYTQPEPAPPAQLVDPQRPEDFASQLSSFLAQASTGSYAAAKAIGMSDVEACARAAETEATKKRLQDELFANIPMPPGYDPTNGIVNIHRQVGAPIDYYAEGKAMGMTDEAACSYAIQGAAGAVPDFSRPR